MYFGFHKNCFGLLKNFIMFKNFNYKVVGAEEKGFRFINNKADVSRKELCSIFKFHFFKRFFQQKIHFLFRYFNIVRQNTINKKWYETILRNSFYLTKKSNLVLYNAKMIENKIQNRLQLLSNKRFRHILKFFSLTAVGYSSKRLLLKKILLNKLKKLNYVSPNLKYNKFLLKFLFLYFNKFRFLKIRYKYMRKFLFIKEYKKFVYNKNSIENRLKRILFTRKKLFLISLKGGVFLKKKINKIYFKNLKKIKNLLLKAIVKKIFNNFFLFLFKCFKKIYRPIFLRKKILIFLLRKKIKIFNSNKSLKKKLNFKKVFNVYKLVFFFFVDRFKKRFKKIIFIFIKFFKNLFAFKVKKNIFCSLSLIKRFLQKEM
jgi:hypothetical protein